MSSALPLSTFISTLTDSTVDGTEEIVKGMTFRDSNLTISPCASERTMSVKDLRARQVERLRNCPTESTEKRYIRVSNRMMQTSNS